MNASAMARGLKQRVVDDNVGLYATLLASTGAATEPVWIDAMRLYRSLAAEDQGAFMAFVRISRGARWVWPRTFPQGCGAFSRR